ncbi:MAG: transposase [Candidatus Melainabacteria bacterium]|nr:transposase [Candidatus Melainabacteria bacterium]
MIGFEVSCQLDIIKAMLQRLKHIQFRYACPGCNSNVILAPKPDGPIEKGYATAALISYIGVSKFDYHQPLYRQEKFFRSYTVPVSRSSMCRWLKSAADIFEIVVERMRQLILNSRVIQADHTTMPMLKKRKREGSPELHLDLPGRRLAAIHLLRLHRDAAGYSSQESTEGFHRRPANRLRQLFPGCRCHSCRMLVPCLPLHGGCQRRRPGARRLRSCDH